MTLNDGTTQVVGPERLGRLSEALDARMAAAARNGEHVFAVMAAYSISDDTARRLAHGQTDGVLLDAENLLSLAPGCFRCEEALTPRLLHRRCRGEPSS